MREMDKTLARPRQRLYALFVDFKAAFDPGSRAVVLRKMASYGVPRQHPEFAESHPPEELGLH